jgi:hypothetical protein
MVEPHHQPRQRVRGLPSAAGLDGNLHVSCSSVRAYVSWQAS